MVNCQNSPSPFKYYEEISLCLHEKLKILMYPDPEELLNKRSVILCRCPHERRYLFSNYVIYNNFAQLYSPEDEQLYSPEDETQQHETQSSELMKQFYLFLWKQKY